MTFQVCKGFPPDLESPIAELLVRYDGRDGVDAPMVISQEGGVLRLTIYDREGGIAWEYPVDELLEAIAKGVDLLRS